MEVFNGIAVVWHCSARACRKDALEESRPDVFNGYFQRIVKGRRDYALTTKVFNVE